VAQLSVPGRASQVALCDGQSCHTLRRPMPGCRPYDSITLRFRGRRCISLAHCAGAPNVFLANTPGAGFIRKRRQWNTASASRTVVHRARSPMNDMTVERRSRRPRQCRARAPRTVPMPCTLSFESAAAEFRVSCAAAESRTQTLQRLAAHAAAGFSATGRASEHRFRAGSTNAGDL